VTEEKFLTRRWNYIILLFWFFFVPFFTPMSYRTGFAVYSAILLSHLIANTYINLRALSPAQYRAFPIRIP
jgi:hypothetical protein